MYIKNVMTGGNYLNNVSLRSAACTGYDLAVEKLFLLREHPSPVDFSDKTNLTRTSTRTL